MFIMDKDQSYTHQELRMKECGSMADQRVSKYCIVRKPPCLMFTLFVVVYILSVGEPVQLKVCGIQSEILIEQGKKFTIEFECVDAEGRVVSMGKSVT